MNPHVYQSISAVEEAMKQQLALHMGDSTTHISREMTHDIPAKVITHDAMRHLYEYPYTRNITTRYSAYIDDGFTKNLPNPREFAPSAPAWIKNISYEPQIDGTMRSIIDVEWSLDDVINLVDKKTYYQTYLQNKKVNFIIRSRGDVIRGVPKNEQIAIETLREELLESEFRRYIKYGFIVVKGTSGKFYQIFRNDNHIKVWFNGVLVEEICIYLNDRNIPPTDKLIAFKAMIETSEESFKTFGNVYNMKRAA